MQAGDDRSIFLSTLPASRRDRTAALAVVVVSSVLFACAVPFARVPLTPVPAFVASYQSALAINDLFTAILLFSQFSIMRSRALLLLASGYLFTSVVAVVTIVILKMPGATMVEGIWTLRRSMTAARILMMRHSMMAVAALMMEARVVATTAALPETGRFLSGNFVRST